MTLLYPTNTTKLNKPNKRPCSRQNEKLGKLHKTEGLYAHSYTAATICLAGTSQQYVKSHVQEAQAAMGEDDPGQVGHRSQQGIADSIEGEQIGGLGSSTAPGQPGGQCVSFGLVHAGENLTILCYCLH